MSTLASPGRTTPSTRGGGASASLPRVSTATRRRSRSARAAEIEALSPPDKLRLAADLLDAQRPEIAKSIVDKVGAELGAAMLLGRLGR